MTSLRNAALFAGYLAVFSLAGVLAWGAHHDGYFAADVDIALAVQGIRSPLIDAAMGFLSALGSRAMSVVIMAVVALCLVARRYSLEALFVLAGIGGDGLNYLLKDIVARPRPVSTGLVSVLQADADASFPSGHAVHSVIVFGFLFYLASVHVQNTAARTGLQALLIALTVLIGLSRIYLGAHWPSDVFGGYLVRGLVLAPLILLYRLAIRYADLWPVWLRRLSGSSRVLEE